MFILVIVCTLYVTLLLFNLVNQCFRIDTTKWGFASYFIFKREFDKYDWEWKLWNEDWCIATSNFSSRISSGQCIVNNVSMLVVEPINYILMNIYQSI